MTKKYLEGAGKFSYHYPQLAVVVTSYSKGKSNAMAVAWHSPISVKPPLYGISITPGRSTYRLIMDSGEFGVNFVSLERAELIASVGGCKGKDTDKFLVFDIAQYKGQKTSVPILNDAYLAFECKLKVNTVYGDHEWLVGEILGTHIDVDAFNEEGVLDVARINPALYLSGEMYVTTSEETLKRLDRKEYGGRRNG